MKKGYFIIGLIAVMLVLAVFISGCSKTLYLSCPDSLLHNFGQKVENREEAVLLLREFFSEEKGFPLFNESGVEYIESEGIYTYGNFYSLEGGILKTDGKLIRKGYCK